MIWDAIVINRATIGEIWNGLRQQLRRLPILNRVLKPFSRCQLVIFSTIQRRIKALKASALYSQSNDITVNQLISLLCGDFSVLKRRFYARKSWLIESGNNLIEEFSQFMNGADFDKILIASKQVFQKDANIRAVLNEYEIWRVSKCWGMPDIETPMLKRFGLDPNKSNFQDTLGAWVKKQARDIKNSQDFLNKDNGKESKAIDYADFITDLLITINDNHFIDKSTITALDFYKMYTKFKLKQQENGRLRNR